MRAVIEFCLIFDGFRNIDLVQQGYYLLRTSILHKASQQYACPYNLVNLESKRGVHNMLDPHLEEFYVYSKCFLIRFFEELISLREVVYMRTEIDYDESEHTIVIDLLFSETAEPFNFSVISSAEFPLKFPSTFVCEFIPVIFDSTYFSLLNLTAQYLVLEYKFESSETDKACVAASCLFSKSGKLKKYIGASETDSAYEKLSTPLINTYSALKDTFSNVMEECISHDLRLKLKLFYQPPPLNSPGNSAQTPYNFIGINEKTVEEDLTSFSSRAACHDPLQVANLLLLELGSISAQLLQVWHKFGEMTCKIYKRFRLYLQDKHRASIKKVLAGGLIYEMKRTDSLQNVENEFSIKSYKAAAKCRRLQNSLNADKNPSIDPMTQPIIIEEYSVSRVLKDLPEKEIKRPEGSHLFVFVHGFQGSANDLRLLKNQISAFNPNGYFLLSSVNEDNTESSIEVLGLKLALEVNSYIIEYFDTKMPDKISFLGHSLGGLIIRAALPQLEKFANLMHLFMSFGTPHLGIHQNSSKLIQAGLWFMKSIRDSDCLKQLRYEDEHGFLYRLSKFEGLKWFKHCVVFSSPQDMYVPHHSARVEHRKREESIVTEMANNILGQRETIHRMTVDFKIPNRIIDSFIGRAAHIQILEDPLVMKTVIYLHPEFFL